MGCLIGWKLHIIYHVGSILALYDKLWKLVKNCDDWTQKESILTSEQVTCMISLIKVQS